MFAPVAAAQAQHMSTCMAVKTSTGTGSSMSSTLMSPVAALMRPELAVGVRPERDVSMAFYQHVFDAIMQRGTKPAYLVANLAECVPLLVAPVL